MTNQATENNRKVVLDSLYYDHQDIMQQDHPPEAVAISAVGADSPLRPSWLRIVWGRLTGSWVERNHARLQHKYLRPQPERTEEGMLDLIRLAELRENVNAAEWTLLMALAAGVAYHEMTGMTTGGARKRVARLRVRLRQIAGQQRPEHASESSRR